MSAARVSDVAAIARLFGVTEDQAKAQLARNAVALRAMHARAAAAPNGMHRGYTADQLDAHASAFERPLRAAS